MVAEVGQQRVSPFVDARTSDPKERSIVGIVTSGVGVGIHLGWHQPERMDFFPDFTAVEAVFFSVPFREVFALYVGVCVFLLFVRAFQCL